MRMLVESWHMEFCYLHFPSFFLTTCQVGILRLNWPWGTKAENRPRNTAHANRQGGMQDCHIIFYGVSILEVPKVYFGSLKCQKVWKIIISVAMSIWLAGNPMTLFLLILKSTWFVRKYSQHENNKTTPFDIFPQVRTLNLQIQIEPEVKTLTG